MARGYNGSEGQYQNLYKKMMQGIISKEELEILTETKMENHRSYPKMQRMWPTPRVSDTEGGVVKNVELKNGAFSRVNKEGVRWGVKLKDAVHHMEEKMWPTPTANEDAAGTPNGKMQGMLGNHPGVRGTTPKEWASGALNPTLSLIHI